MSDCRSRSPIDEGSRLSPRGPRSRCGLNPVNETERMRNRRVEVFTAWALSRSPEPPTPFCGGMPTTVPPVELRALRVLAQTVLESVPGPLRVGIKPPTTLRFLISYRTRRGGEGISRQPRLQPHSVVRRSWHVRSNVHHRRQHQPGTVRHSAVGDTASCWASTRPGDLIHELTHAWQSQHHRDSTAFMANSVKCQSRSLG